MASTVLPNGIIIPEKYSRDWYADLYHNWQELDNLLGGGTPKDGTLTIQKNGTTVGTFSANQATDETINITVPDVNDATLTIQQNGTTVDTFTANSSTDKTVDITVPTKTSDLTNDSNFVPSTDLATVATSGNYNDLSNKPTIPTVNNATLTIQKNGTTVKTFTANASSNVTANITVPTKTSDLTNDSNFVDTSNSAVSSGITSAKVTDYDTHIADTDIHVTTADKTKWNNQTYVFRYSSTALTASSTNSNALLDNTDNLKVGDKVIDSSGVLFSITAIDTQNSTFTIGTALIDLANDSDVVHKSGNEAKSGELTLSDTLNSSDIVPRSNDTYAFGSVSNLLRNLYTYHGYFRGQQQGDEYSSNARTNLTLTSNRDTLGQSGIVFDSFRENTAQGTGSHILGFGLKENSVRYEGCRFFWLYDNNNNGYIFSLRPTTQGINRPIKYELGTSSAKWSTINGLNPSSLGMPDLSNRIDISSYIDVTQTSQYTAPADGYISICGYASSTNAILIKDHNCDFAMTAIAMTTSLGATTYLTIPVVKNHVYDITCSAVSIIEYAKFYPCQGNV